MRLATAPPTPMRVRGSVADANCSFVADLDAVRSGCEGARVEGKNEGGLESDTLSCGD